MTWGHTDKSTNMLPEWDICVSSHDSLESEINYDNYNLFNITIVRLNSKKDA
jgi:hypothetical protein